MEWEWEDTKLILQSTALYLLSESGRRVRKKMIQAKISNTMTLFPHHVHTQRYTASCRVFCSFPEDDHAERIHQRSVTDIISRLYYKRSQSVPWGNIPMFIFICLWLAITRSRLPRNLIIWLTSHSETTPWHAFFWFADANYQFTRLINPTPPLMTMFLIKNQNNLFYHHVHSNTMQCKISLESSQESLYPKTVTQPFFQKQQ